MNRKTAEDLLPKFKNLEGTFSGHFSCRIEQVVVAHRSFAMIKWHKETLKKSPSTNTGLDEDEADYTIVGVLRNGRMQSVRTLVRTEQIHELYPEEKLVDYMIP